MPLLFADCSLDLDARRLIRQGVEVHLSAKAFDLLKLLAESRPRALSKGVLLECGWPGLFVSDASLAKMISEIREAVGDHASGSRIIRTVHRYGYAFVAEIAPVEGVAADERQTHPMCRFVCGDRQFPLREGEQIIGREPDADICLDSPRVSRRHAKVVVASRETSLEDLGSKNGSFVRGVRITSRRMLRPGDHVRIGPFRLVFSVIAPSRTTETDTASRDT